ncbi:hypothetical protein GF377_11010 [candidate division GN15 bacterium]|nr:hypothetical protein [candidate division GN15 bacterium]
MKLGFAILLTAALATLVGCSDQEPALPLSSQSGFADVTPDGRHGLIVGERQVGTDSTETVVYIVDIVDLHGATYHIADSVTGNIGDAALLTDTTMVFAQVTNETTRMMAASLSNLSSARELTRIDTVPPRVSVCPGETHVAYREPAGWTLRELGGDEEIERFMDAVTSGGFTRDCRAFIGIVNDFAGDDQTKEWRSWLVRYQTDGSGLDTLVEVQSAFGRPVAETADSPVYFLSSMPDFTAANVWKYDPSTRELTAVTDMQPPDFVSIFHLVGDSLAVLQRDPSQPPEAQYTCQMYSK